ncbi:hypothetical protein TTHERM_000903859 (macronuclear) [Tetrahymena thermophila SB210]|uniref:Uncharacterized protein n=1 Tax=Tetrahymena thermophila (strain SB210) TaxID=312017 RepID=W7XE92_TETTS|nr:hypothetical protein TTHERM_000903859 [Tetrahymena thermophila SB210]EWS71189.1 hypothetical protein TTHERM_000903859 [Tetrahymena thermophila SB210]|eukprot:XP_012656287.1 hypothetical protein TTHERM_000903859 [Tetrahymena thermophila SB210]
MKQEELYINNERKLINQQIINPDITKDYRIQLLDTSLYQNIVFIAFKPKTITIDKNSPKISSQIALFNLTLNSQEFSYKIHVKVIIQTGSKLQNMIYANIKTQYESVITANNVSIYPVIFSRTKKIQDNLIDKTSINHPLRQLNNIKKNDSYYLDIYSFQSFQETSLISQILANSYPVLREKNDITLTTRSVI